MKKHEKEVIQAELDAEAKVLRDLERQYQAAMKSVDDKLAQLLGRSDADMPNVIYQVEHQKALRTQIHGILEQLQANEFQTISDFLASSYQQGFIGTMYSMHNQGIPLILPIDKNAMVKAVTTNSRLSEDLYSALGVDIRKLNNAVRSEISRGISAGLSYNEIARNIANASKAPRSRAATIVRTESHRIREESRNDARDMAKKKGADVVKQWDSTLDGDTRKSHRKLDGQIREVDEPFEVDGKKAMYPGDFGRPEEDINCRCISLTRARWELDEAELETLKKRAEFFGIDKTDDFADYEKKYLASANRITLNQEGEQAHPPQEYDGAFDDFQPLELNKNEEDALSTLRTATRESGFEQCIIIEGNKVSGISTSGLPDAVKMPIENHGSGLTVLHSHTNATPPSAADFRKLLNEKVDKIGAIGYNNDTYIAYIGEGWIPDLEEFNDAVDRIRNEATAAIMEDPNFFSWSVAERNYMAIREQAYRIALEFGWTLEGGRFDG